MGKATLLALLHLGDRQVIILATKSGSGRKRNAAGPRRRVGVLTQAGKLAAIDQIATSIAHDFNNVLTAIVGHLELVERKMADRPREAERIRKAIAAAFQGRALTQQLLTFSHRRQWSGIAVDIAAVMDGVDRTLGLLGSDLSTAFDIESGLWHARTNPQQLEMIIVNVAMAARGADPDGGTIRVKARNLRVEGHARLPDGDYVDLTITAPTAFAPPVHNGSGDIAEARRDLNLTAAFAFARQSEGDAEVNDRRGASELRLHLPRAAMGMQKTAYGIVEPAKPRRALLVEDEENVREISRSLLTDLDFHVTEARNGDEAVALLKRGARFELLFTDIVMPGRHNGVDVAVTARDLLPGIKVLFTSGFPRQSLETRAPNLADAPFIAKPFRYEQLKIQIRNLLG